MDAARDEPRETASPGTFASPRQVPIKWKGEQPVLYANLLWGIVDDLGDIVISIGQVEPVVIPGSSIEERQKAVDAIPYMEGQVLFRFSASPERLERMVEQINAVVRIRETWQREVLSREEKGT